MNRKGRKRKFQKGREGGGPDGEKIIERVMNGLIVMFVSL